MTAGSRAIPLNYSIAVPVWHYMKRAILTLYEKHNIENKGPDIRVPNKSASIERW